MGWRHDTTTWFTRLSPEWKVRTALGVGLTLSNAVGGIVVLVLALVVVPLPPVDRQRVVESQNLLLAGAFVLVVALVGTWQAWRVLHPVVVMLRPGDQPTDDDRRDVLRAPRRIFVFQAALWALASVVFLAFNARYSWDLAFALFQMVALAGWATSCQTYLLAERALRPVARAVLSTGFPSRRYVPSVRDRAMFAWALGTGVGLLGVVLVGVSALRRPADYSVQQLAVTVIVIGALALAIGWLSSFGAAQASNEPIRNLRYAVGRVEEGRLDVTVPIYDGTEIGLLQAGFNEMVRGLREREELRDVFGKHVGAEVARSALEGGAKLGGEVRDVAVLFVDLVGSTSLAEDRDPEEVVGLLNRFFEVVIEVVHDHHGWINKFEGDAALAIWGAPLVPERMPDNALAAARTMQRRLRRELPGIKAGIGLSCGAAVAGNVGAAERYEYTVIGDPVNEAARLTDEAKQLAGGVAANYLLVEAAGDEEAAHWGEEGTVTLRGRSAPTRLASPR